MKLIHICLGSLVVVVVLVIGLTLPGCESDPLLAPQTEVADEGGSYGNTNLPPGGANTTKTDVNPAQNNKAGNSRLQNTNPKRF